jgi:site-specific DNA recombinase
MRAVLFARVSSDSQDVDFSISAQLKALREYANKHGYQVVKEYIDEAEIGRTSARPAFKEMVALARWSDKPFDAILVWKYSRLARSREDSILYKAMLKKNGFTVVSINEPFDDSPTGRLPEGIIESIDKFYSDNLGEDVTRGMRESASRGFYLLSKPPFGYRKVKVLDGNKEPARLEPAPYQASIVKEMFESIKSGRSLTNIVKSLNAKGIPSPRGKKWGKTAVHEIITNEIHNGTFVWGINSKRGLQPVRTENTCPTIVDSDTFIMA